jgi:predicted PurR-regulated permease PerM
VKKKLIAALTTLLVLALAAPALAATLTPEQSQEIVKLHQQMLELKKQIIDKYVEYGSLTPEQGQQIKARIEAIQKFLQENPDWFSQCPGFGPGFGRGCAGCGLRGIMGGWQWNNTPQTNS